jgi:hypothetical protein
MNYTNVKAMVVSLDEANALNTASQTLLDVMTALGGENTIMSLETGEVITPGELARARAVLEFIATYRMVEVNPQ